MPKLGEKHKPETLKKLKFSMRMYWRKIKYKNIKKVVK